MHYSETSNSSIDVALKMALQLNQMRRSNNYDYHNSDKKVINASTTTNNNNNNNNNNNSTYQMPIRVLSLKGCHYKISNKLQYISKTDGFSSFHGCNTCQDVQTMSIPYPSLGFRKGVLGVDLSEISNVSIM